MDILWSDISEYQVPVTDAYPYQVLAIRSNDGTYKDLHFTANYQWACRALDIGKLRALIIYLVYRPNWQDDFKALKAVIGNQPHPRTAFMLDVESWGGEITCNQSVTVDNLYQAIAAWIGNPKRVIGYGNINDLNTIWPQRPPNTRLIIAAYGSNPAYPNELGHQFTDGAVGGPLYVPPFGFADVNSADGYTIDSFCAALGLTAGHHDHRRDSMPILPATPMPADPNSDPKTWPQTNYDVTFAPGEGWSCVIGAEEFAGRTKDAIRGFLLLASWETPSGLVPVAPALAVGGGGIVIYDHAPTVTFIAPTDASGLTLNYAFPGGGTVGI